MQVEANLILDIFNLKANINLTDADRLVLIEKVLVGVYNDGKYNGKIQAITAINNFQADLIESVKLEFNDFGI